MPSTPFDSQSALLHVLQISLVGPKVSSKNIVSQREHNIEVPVQVSVMQAVISCQKLIDRPGAEDPLLRLVHLQMNFVPRPVMKNHNGHKNRRPLPGYQCNKRSKWHSFDRRLAHSQPYLLVFATRDWFIAEYLGVMPVMHKSVSLKYTLEGRSMRTEEVLSVHQLPVRLVLDKGRQNARENEPPTDLPNQHQRFLDSPLLLLLGKYPSRLSRDFGYGAICRARAAGHAARVCHVCQVSVDWLNVVRTMAAHVARCPPSP